MRLRGWKTEAFSMLSTLSGNGHYHRVKTDRSAGKELVSTGVYLLPAGIVTARWPRPLFCVFCVGYSRPATVSVMR